MPKFRKKPVVIEAVQWDGRTEPLIEMLPEDPNQPGYTTWPEHFTLNNDVLYITTLEGEMRCDIGSWVIKGVNGEFYPCANDIFEKTYEAV